MNVSCLLDGKEREVRETTVAPTPERPPQNRN